MGLTKTTSNQRLAREPFGEGAAGSPLTQCGHAGKMKRINGVVRMNPLLPDRRKDNSKRHQWRNLFNIRDHSVDCQLLL